MKRIDLSLRKLAKAASGAAVIISLLAAFSVTARAQSPTAFRKGEVVVELKPGASIEAVNARNNTSTRLQIYGTNFYRL
ncbi:MAG TPA: hypothetical protein VKC34_13325, partial [Blastocatellia bacterium]|nr:hypothetical protein [Blastocatellia bacterium]